MVTFELTVTMLVEYLAWRNTQHTPRKVLEIYRLIESIEPTHITSALELGESYTLFMKYLRYDYGYKWLTAQEGCIIYGLVVLQNRTDGANGLVKQLDKDYEDTDFGTRFPEVFRYARRKEKVGRTKKSALLIKANAARRLSKWRANKRLSVQGE